MSSLATGLAVFAIIIAILGSIIGMASPAPGTGTSFGPDSSETWTAMPSATTELFGTTNHRLNLTAGIATIIVTLVVTCTVASSTSGAILTLQYSTNNGGAWQFPGGSLAASPQVKIDSTKCPGLVQSKTVTASLGTPLKALWRIAGNGGGGSGDNPSFKNIYLVMYSSSSVIPSCSPTVDDTVASPSTTQFYYNVFCASPVNINGEQWGLYWIARDPILNVVQDGFDAGCAIGGLAQSCASGPILVSFPIAFTNPPDVIISNGHTPASAGSLLISTGVFLAV